MPNLWQDLEGYVRMKVRMALADKADLDDAFVYELAQEAHALHRKAGKPTSRGLEEAHRSQLGRYENMVKRALRDLARKT